MRAFGTIWGMHNGLLLVAHGSRREQSNHEIRTLAHQLATRPDKPCRHVACAFLELATPSIPEGIAQLADSGAQHVVVLPYFLANGRHVHADIPAQVAIGAQAQPQLTIDIAPYIGTAADMPDLLLSLAAGTLDSAQT